MCGPFLFVAAALSLHCTSGLSLSPTTKQYVSPSRKWVPLEPAKIKPAKLKPCSKSLKDVRDEHEATMKIYDIFRKAYPNAGVLIQNKNKACLVNGSTETGKVFSVAEENDKDICENNTNKDQEVKRKFTEEKFNVKGKVLTKLKDERGYETIFPEEGTCTKDSRCSLVMFFHGCGGFLPYRQMAMYDNKCFKKLKTIFVFPKLLNRKGQGNETWTGDGDAVLEEFVMPLLQDFKKKYGDLIEESRIVSMGESLGSAMALQAGLLYPDVFSTIVATGLTSGHSCKDVSALDPKIVLPKKSTRPASMLKTIVATFASRELEVTGRASKLLELLSESGVGDNVSVRYHVFPNMGHTDSILQSQNNWKSLYNAIWKGKVG